MLKSAKSSKFLRKLQVRENSPQNRQLNVNKLQQVSKWIHFSTRQGELNRFVFSKTLSVQVVGTKVQSSGQVRKFAQSSKFQNRKFWENQYFKGV